MVGGCYGQLVDRYGCWAVELQLAYQYQLLSHTSITTHNNQQNSTQYKYSPTARAPPRVSNIIM